MVEQQLYLNPSSKRLVIIIVIAILLHLLCMYMLLHQYGIPLPEQVEPPLDENAYIAQQLLSAGQQQATVTFQHEPPSDDVHEQEQLPTPHAQEEATTAMALPETIETPTTRPQPTHPRRAARPLPARQKTTNHDPTKLAQITQGFLQSMQQEAGFNQPAVQDIRQLSLQMYSSKLWHIIKQAFLAEDNSIHLSRPVQAQTQLVVTIDRDGKLRDIALLYPQHMPELRLVERLIVSRAQHAGLFPPLPNSVTTASKSFCFPLYIKGEAGVHSYSLSYQ
jgi:hypothetical protein